jgi:hypothetical protein
MATVIGLAGAYYADRWLGTAPDSRCLGIGIVAGFVNLFQATRR